MSEKKDGPGTVLWKKYEIFPPAVILFPDQLKGLSV